jgi:hypothetical protein
MKNLMKLNVDTMFMSLLPPTPDEDLQKLEAALMMDGCQEPIFTWNGIIVDGHKRYQLCQKHQIPYETRALNFSNRYQAISWICKDKLANNKITTETRKYLIGKQYEAEKNNYLLEAGIPLLQTHGCNYLVADKVGRLYHLEQNTVYKYGLYASNIDEILSKNERIGKMILSDTLKISHESVCDLSSFSPAQLRIIETSMVSDSKIHYTNADIRCSVGRMSGAAPQPKIIRHIKELHQREMQIKQTPKFDPDTELSSLMYTIPSWIGSMQRMENYNYLPVASASSKEKLVAQLMELNLETHQLIDKLEDRPL